MKLFFGFLLTSLITIFSLCATKVDSFKLCFGQSKNPCIFNHKSIEEKKELSNPYENIETYSLKTNSGLEIPVIFYNRNSDVLIIAAPALPAPKESMKVFSELFPACDVIMFDYRWAGHYGSFLCKSIMTAKPIQKVLLHELEELQTVVNYATTRKNYTTVVGLGECYSCFHLAKLQSDSVKKTGMGPFTHLILDSSWYSLHDFAERICYDPLLPISSQEGGAPAFVKYVTNSFLFKKIVLGTAFSLIPDISIQSYISTLEIPILFIHGSQDLFVPINHFEKIWHATNKDNRAVLFTPFEHANNLKNKAIYQFITNLFIKSQTTHEFEKMIADINS